MGWFELWFLRPSFILRNGPIFETWLFLSRQRAIATVANLAGCRHRDFRCAQSN